MPIWERRRGLDCEGEREASPSLSWVERLGPYRGGDPRASGWIESVAVWMWQLRTVVTDLCVTMLTVVLAATIVVVLLSMAWKTASSDGDIVIHVTSLRIKNTAGLIPLAGLTGWILQCLLRRRQDKRGSARA